MLKPDYYLSLIFYMKYEPIFILLIDLYVLKFHIWFSFWLSYQNYFLMSKYFSCSFLFIFKLTES